MSSPESSSPEVTEGEFKGRISIGDLIDNWNGSSLPPETRLTLPFYMALDLDSKVQTYRTNITALKADSKATAKHVRAFETMCEDLQHEITEVRKHRNTFPVVISDTVEDVDKSARLMVAWNDFLRKYQVKIERLHPRMMEAAEKLRVLKQEADRDMTTKLSGPIKRADTPVPE